MPVYGAVWHCGTACPRWHVGHVPMNEVGGSFTESRFTVSAGMTASQASNLARHLVREEDQPAVPGHIQ